MLALTNKSSKKETTFDRSDRARVHCTMSLCVCSRRAGGGGGAGSVFGYVRSHLFMF